MNASQSAARRRLLLSRVRHGAFCISAAILGSSGGALSFSSSGPLATTTTAVQRSAITTVIHRSSSPSSISPRFSSTIHPRGGSLSVLQGTPLSRRHRTPSSPLYMNWLQNFFGGGAYNTRIDYSALAFPCPELAELAMAAAGPQKMPTYSPSQPHLELATFAGGCFWGLELAYQRVPGVVYTASGYTAGPEPGPTYDQVCAGNTGHTEAVCVYFDPKETSYETLLDTFFERVDPTTKNGQGRDFGRQYRTGVYYHGEEQEKLARARFEKEQTKYKRPIASECLAATSFWPAEEYHQQYLSKGGRFGMPQSAEKGATDEIRCYG